MQAPKVIWQCSCSVNTQKTNLQHFFLQCWRLKNSNFSRTVLHQGDLLRKFKESNLAKVNFLKLLTKENPVECFHQLTIYQISLKKVRAKKVDFSTIKIKLKKVSRNAVDMSKREITSKKVRGCKVDFSTIKITSRKVRGNNVYFSTIEMMSKNVCGNDVEFSIREITLKKFMEMTWKFVEIWSSTYRRNTTSNQRG